MNCYIQLLLVAITDRMASRLLVVVPAFDHFDETLGLF